MRIILIGGGETIETIYFLARHFSKEGGQVTVLDPDPDEARMLSQRVQATVILGDGSDPAALEQAGARRADVLIALAAYDPDNLVACQIAQQMFGVPRTMALVNDPENEAVFHQLGIDIVFSATKIIGLLISEHTAYEDIANLIPVADGRVHVSEVILPKGAPGAGRPLKELGLPHGCLVTTVIRRGKVIVPGGNDALQVADRLVLVTLIENHEQALQILTGDRGL